VIAIGIPLLVGGDVKLPSGEIVPSDADQLTAELLVPLTVAANRVCPCGTNTANAGETAIWICAAERMLCAEFPTLTEPQPSAMISASPARMSIAIRWRLAKIFCGAQEKLGDSSCKTTGRTSILDLAMTREPSYYSCYIFGVAGSNRMYRSTISQGR
jgi:hypothetical protein